MGQYFGHVNERAQEGELARVHEVPEADRALQTGSGSDIPSDQRVDRVDPEMAAMLEEAK
jgi:hypothetical protein